MTSRTNRRCARASIAGVLLALGLILDPDGLLAQEPAPKPGPASESEIRVQRFRTRKARAAYEVARLNREIAEIAVDEYQEGTYIQTLATADGEIKLAEANLQRAKDRLEWARRMSRTGRLPGHLASYEMDLKKARYTLEQAETQKQVLLKYTRPKTIEALQAEVCRARKAELEKEGAWLREAAKQARMERLIERI